MTLYLWTEMTDCCSCSGEYIKIVESHASREATEKALQSMLQNPEEGGIQAVISDLKDGLRIEALLDLLTQYARNNKWRASNLRKLFVPGYYKGHVGCFSIECECKNRRIEAKIVEDRKIFTNLILERLPIAELKESIQKLKEKGMDLEARGAQMRHDHLLAQTNQQVDYVFMTKKHDLRRQYTEGAEKIGPDPDCKHCAGSGHEVITL